MAIQYIEQPKDKVIHTRTGPTRGSSNIVVKWEPRFKHQWNTRYNRAQRFVDARVLYLSEAYIPTDTGALLLSGRRYTRIGSGLVMWLAPGRPYTRPQYYGWRRKHIKSLPKIRKGKWWFLRMKAQNKKPITEKAKAIAGGGG